MSNRMLLLSLALIPFCVAVLEAADIFAIARQSYNSSPFIHYQYGWFDIDTPDTSGGAGNYVYTFTPVGALGSSLANLAFNPTNSTMYVVSNFNEYRSIDTSGTMSANLGTISANGGMAFDLAGNLHSLNGSYNLMLNLNPATGATISSATLSTTIYSSFGGNMAWQGGQYYFADEITKSLVTVAPNGQITTQGAFAGTGYVGNKSHVLFTHLNHMYIVNGLNMFTVDETNGALTMLGTISGVVGGNPSPGFSGATSLTPVPEPSSFAMAFAASGVAFAPRYWRRTGNA